MDTKQITADFLSGRLDIAEYRRLFDEGQELEVFLQKIVDDIRHQTERLSHILFCWMTATSSWVLKVSPIFSRLKLTQAWHMACRLNMNPSGKC